MTILFGLVLFMLIIFFVVEVCIAVSGFLLQNSVKMIVIFSGVKNAERN